MRGYHCTAASAAVCALAGCADNPYEIGRFVDHACEQRAEALFCSGFERPDLSEWDGVIAYNTGEIEQTDAMSRSGRGALHAASRGEESTGAVFCEFPALTAGDLFLRVYMYVADGQETKTTNVLFLGDEPAPDPFKGIDFNFEAGAPEIFVPENDPVRFTSSALVIPRDRWFCYQVHLVIAEEGAVTITIEGETALAVMALDTLPPGGIHLLRAGIDWSSLQTTPFDIYMDDLVLSTEPVSCD